MFDKKLVNPITNYMPAHRNEARAPYTYIEVLTNPNYLLNNNSTKREVCPRRCNFCMLIVIPRIFAKFSVAAVLTKLVGLG